MINLFGAVASPGYRVPSGGNTRETKVNGGAGLFGLWPKPQYRTDCRPPNEPRLSTMITTMAPASSGFFAAPQPAYNDCRNKIATLEAARKAADDDEDDDKPKSTRKKAADDDDKSKSSAPTKPAK